MRGSSIVEVLVALALAAVAAGGLAATAGTSVRALVQAGRDAAALTLATERLETLRAGPRADGVDSTVASDGATFSRTWAVSAGRGRPDQLATSVTWGPHRLDLETEVWP
ncbi:MAG TPA: hypothetical protein VMS22_22010 [Candidatus Eisenbacteria bacterium]|nr:hypothetical protein [Candidatus Eisenbacteria bacterium]